VLSDAARGERLPTLAVTRSYVAACGGDPDEWQARWYLCREWLTAAHPVTVRTGDGEHVGADSSYATPHSTATATSSPRARQRGKAARRIHVGKRQLILAICLAVVLTQAEAVTVWRLASGQSTTARTPTAAPSPDGANPNISNCVGGGNQQQGKFPWPCSGAPYQVTGTAGSLPEWTLNPKGGWTEIGTIPNGYTLWVSCQANDGPQENHKYNVYPSVPSRTWDRTWDSGKGRFVWVYGWWMNTPPEEAAYNWYSWPDSAHHCNF
jgi:hypothetical protein